MINFLVKAVLIFILALAICSFEWLAPIYSEWLMLSVVIISLLLVLRQMELTKKRTTLDLLFKYEENAHFKPVEEISSLEPTDLRIYAIRYGEISDEDMAIATKIKNYLNFYELISLGILDGSFDEETYKSWYKSSFVVDWNYHRFYIAHLRNQSSSYQNCYTNFETLAKKWKGLDLPPIEKETNCAK